MMRAMGWRWRAAGGAAAAWLLLAAAPLARAQASGVAPTEASSVAPARAASGADAAPAEKVLRIALPVAETGFDPAQVSDRYSRTLIANMLDALYTFEFLARPVRLRPNTAVAMPEAASDFKTFTVRLRPGIRFADDPAFHGAPRELVAQDYVYAIERHFDPALKSSAYATLANNRILGLEELRTQALRTGRPFDYDAPVEGLRALDRYTLQFRLARPNPRFAVELSDPAITGAVAREVVEAYGDKIMAHPVGTGPFRLARWQRSSVIELERNPNYRDEFYAEHPPADDPRAQAAAKALAGRRMPMVDRIVASVVEQAQPRWLAFVNRELDVVAVPEEFIGLAMPNGRLAPNLARQGIIAVRTLNDDIAMTYFAMENPVVGGYSPAHVALRRAIGMAVDVETEIRVARRGQAIPAQSIVGPGVWGYDPAFRSSMSAFDRAGAQALLDLYGYQDRNGDGWREQPDGSPLVLEYATQPNEASRLAITLWKKNMDAIGVRMVFKTAQWPENLKASRSGRLMMWGVGWSANAPDAEEFLSLAQGAAKGGNNHARFDLPEYNRLYDLQRSLPDGPERLAAIDAMKRLTVAYMPYKVHVHSIATDLAQPWVVGFDRNMFLREWWRYVDIDPAERARRAR